MSAIMFYDVETTGFSEKTNALIEIAFQPVINGEKQEIKVFKIKPHDGAVISEGALKVNGYTIEEIMKWPEGKDVILEITEYLYSFKKKFKQGGHRVSFDARFLMAFFSRHGCYGDFISLFRSNKVCTLEMAKEQKVEGLHNLKDLCKRFSIPLEGAHQAENDIRATVLLWERLESMNPKVALERFSGDYSKQRREFLDSRYVTFNANGDVYIPAGTFENKQAMRFIINELWDLYCEDDEH